MLGALSILAAIGIGYGVVTHEVTASEACDKSVAQWQLSNMQYFDQAEHDKLVACVNSK